MHVMVLGAGVTGVTTAWFLQQAGFEVSLVDRQPGAGRETSFANGGQISISHPEPWANPAAPWLALRWLGREDAPLKIRPAFDPAQWRWATSFLHECLPWRTRRNTEAIAALALFSGERLRAVRETTGIDYEQRTAGILHLFHTAREFAHAPARASTLHKLGIPAVVRTRDECLALEPALAVRPDGIAGGLYAPDDESGNAQRFTEALAARLGEMGAKLYWNTEIRRLAVTRNRVEGVNVRDAEGRKGMLGADAFVVCLGSYSGRLLRPLGQRVPIYPVKGYSVTAALAAPERAPVVSLTDESRRIVCSRLGDRLRVAGTAELAGFDTSIRPERIKPLLEWVRTHFPDVIDEAQVTPWAGLRPATPSNLPLIGRSHAENLWLNTGHGTLGWTLACGSAAALALLIQGEKPPVAFPFQR